MPMQATAMRLAVIFAASAPGAVSQCVRCYGTSDGQKICAGPNCHGPCGLDYPYSSWEECNQAVDNGTAECGKMKYSLCLYGCTDASGQSVTDQVCKQSMNDGILACPPQSGCSYTSDPWVMDTKEQCYKYDCASGKIPWNSQEPNPCKPHTSGPSPSPPSPSPPSTDKCAQADPEINELCEQKVSGDKFQDDEIPLDCVEKCSGKIHLSPVGYSACSSDSLCLQRCEGFLQGRVCKMTFTEAVALDDANWICRYTPYQQPQDAQWCYNSGLAETAPANTTRPRFEAYLGLDGMRMPFLAGQKSYTKDLTHQVSANKKVSLHYDVELGDAPIVPIDDLDAIVKVDCSANGWMKLRLDHESSMLRIAPLVRQQGAILVGGREWGCRVGSKGEIRSILHRVLRTVPRRSSILVQTELVSHLAIFKHANISFRAAVMPGGHISSQTWAGGKKLANQGSKPSTAVQQQHIKTQMGGWWSAVTSFVRSTWNAVTHVAAAVANVVEEIPQVVKGIATGDFEYKTSYDLTSFSWNYDPNTKGAKEANKDLGDGVTCNECYFDFDASANFDLIIESYALNRAAVWLEGDAQLLMEVATADDAEDEFNVGTLHWPKPGAAPMCTTIAGVPFCLDVTMIVDMGYSIAGQASARVSAAGHMKKGVFYDGKDIHRIDHGVLEVDDEQSKLIDASGSAYVSLNLFPKLVFTVDHIGGPKFGLKGGLEAVVAHEAESPCEDGGVYGALNLGLQFSLGASINVSLGPVKWQHVWDSLLSLTHKLPITSGCFKLNKGELLEAPPSHLAGAQPLQSSATFAGTMPANTGPPWCAGTTPLIVTYQVSEVGDPSTNCCTIGLGGSCPKVIRGQNMISSVPIGQQDANDAIVSYNPFAVGQESMVAEGSVFAPMTNDEFTKYQETSEDSDGRGLPAITYTVQISDDLSTLTLTPTNQGSCYGSATLYRTAKKAREAREAAHLVTNMTTRTSHDAALIV